MAEEADLIVEQRGEVLWVSLNRPHRLNALDDRLIADLRALFRDLYDRRDVRVVVLRGEGRAFCSGLDLKHRQSTGVMNRTVGQMMDSQRRVADIMIAMRRCPQPIVAAVKGAASGGGFALALASDVRIVTADARFNAAFIRIGLSACDVGVSYFLPRMAGASVAAELMLTGKFLDAQRALRLGMVSEIVEPDALDAAAAAMAEDMLSATPLGLRLTKEALNFAIDAPGLEAAVAMEDRNQILCVKDENFEEGIRAFLDKRTPQYSRP